MPAETQLRIRGRAAIARITGASGARHARHRTVRVHPEHRMQAAEIDVAGRVGRHPWRISD